MAADAWDDEAAALVSRCRQGEAAAWTLLVQRYQRLVYAIVLRAGLDEHTAADVFQTVFSRLLVQLPRIAEPGRLQAWIVTTAKREALLQRSRGQRTVSMTREGEGAEEGPELDLPDTAPLAEQQLDDLQQQHRVRLALERIDERCRTLLALLFTDDDERPVYEDVARRLGKPVGSIGPTRARCLAKLRVLLD